MDVSPGYEQSMVGMIPSDWQLRPLGTVGRWFSGGTPSMSHESYWSGDIPWVSPKDMKVSGLRDAIDHISEEAISDGARLLPADAILIVVRGMILAHSLPVARAERPLAFNQDIKAVVPGANVHGLFLLYWLTANAQRLRGLTTESTHGTKRLPTEMLFRELVACPPLVEQEAIAEALSDADALIESLEQLIAKKRHIKQGAMRDLLTGKKRLSPWDVSTSYKNSDVGVVPEDWSVATLGALCNVSAGRDLVKREFSPHQDEKHPFPIYSNAVSNDGLYGFSTSNQHEGEAITVTARGELGHATYRESQFSAIGRLLVLQARTHIDLRFVAARINSCVSFAIESTGVPQLTVPQISTYVVALPSTVDEQYAIASILGDMDADIAAIENKLAKSRQIKQGMMQELLTGRIRLV